MFYVSPEGDRYYPGRAFEYNSAIYTNAGATEETFKALGFTAVDVKPRPDSRFYIASGPDNNGDYTSTPRDLAEVKAMFIAENRQDEGAILSGSDWYVTREQETGKAVPDDWSTYRAAVRTIGEERENQISGAKSVAALETLINAPEMVYSDPNDLSTASVNTDALKPWPVSPDEAAAAVTS